MLAFFFEMGSIIARGYFPESTYGQNTRTDVQDVKSY